MASVRAAATATAEAVTATQLTGGKVATGTVVTDDMRWVYSVVVPKPKLLMSHSRRLVRHGQLVFLSPRDQVKKPRYIFLFEDCLLVCKRKTSTRLRLRVFVQLRSNVRLAENPATMEFRLLVPAVSQRGTTRSVSWRHLVLFARDSLHKKNWLTDLQRCLWIGGGRIGPDPASLSQGIEAIPAATDGESAQLAEQLHARRHQEDEMARQELEACGAQDFFTPFFGQENDDSEGDEDAADAAKPNGQLEPVWTPETELDMLNPLAALSSDDPALNLQGYAIHAGCVQLAFDPFSAPHSAKVAAAQDAFLMDPFLNPAVAGVADPGSFLAGSFLEGMEFDPFATSTAEGDAESPLSTFDPFAEKTMAAGNHSESTAGEVAMENGSMASSGAVDADPSARISSVVMEKAAGLQSVASIVADAGGVESQSPETKELVRLEEMAESELVAAAEAIEIITRQLQDRVHRMTAAAASEEPSLEAMVGAGSAAIAQAAMAMMQGARLAQAERVRQGISGAPSAQGAYHADESWTEGLVGAARSLTASIMHLVQVSEAVEAGSQPLEAMLAAARLVSSNTTHMVTAHRVKGGGSMVAGGSPLEAAAKQLSSATRGMVERVSAAQKQLAAQKSAEAPPPLVKYTLSSAQISELEMQTRVLKLEAETERARQELFQNRRQQYGKK